ncbi:MAG TPA: hydratase [Hydrogenophaga sp.]|uniref:2-keto-4-pentenoate hydratase n=1 Tax=Hydrogenophaga sp. TaxID=1904254 RepID=UPI0008CE76F1|nr:fumarylacetoacetate hydrolase family protein [Hydrogenophaga sp.]OGA78260.1 MAG: hydratase [Burkholderiales bacterium GWE1_65_30]OGA93126.1 MAG: hydratase [Burkholderiales bacterium GWF1_66_17]HAX19242.1 hydratase [Hydrogenophaga sp.]HBU18439.1 hydratase [Hydrogenophaga sp.]
MSQTTAQLAEAIWAARQAGRTLDAEATIGSPDLATAYAIQRALLALRLAAGERVVGWKLGYTSEVMRRQMGIDRPNIGPLTDRMLLDSGDAVNERLVQPRVEPEIGLRLKTALDARQAPVDRQAVAAAVEGAYACLEVVHSTWTGYRFNLEQNTADNSSAGQVVVGPRLPVTDLMALDTVVVRLHNGSHNTLGKGADADGHPLDAVARLARELAAMDRRLEAGDLVITGGLTAACALEVGGRLVGVFSLGDVWSVEAVVRRRGQTNAWEQSQHLSSQRA